MRRNTTTARGIDHLHGKSWARAIYLEPDSRPHNPHVASQARRQGEIAREANRCSDVADANAFYLQQQQHRSLLVVVQGSGRCLPGAIS